jgi:hypothetical protein
VQPVERPRVARVERPPAEAPAGLQAAQQPVLAAVVEIVEVRAALAWVLPLRERVLLLPVPLLA